MSVRKGRFLRDPGLRAVLYHDADGLCSNCGEPLEDSWHADHIIPWTVSHRTNVFEMQALCGQCNAKKGAKMLYQFINEIELRRGQLSAINEIIGRRRRGEAFTSIVVPTRYGKSDIARLSALQMIQDGLVSNALVVVPARNLVEQMLDEVKLRASAERYGFPSEAFLPVQTVERVLRIRRLRNAKITSITTQMANLHLKELLQWVDMTLGPEGPGLPPVVYMDEAHLASDSNTWGRIGPTLAEAGAYLVVMTATPYRSDGRPIPFFKGQRRVLDTTSDGRERVFYELEPHYELTLEEAMLEKPPPVAYITYQPFGIGGTLDNLAEAVIQRVVLDDLSDSDIRRAYREALRDQAIMEPAIRFFLTELQNRRGDPRQAGTAGIVFVGNHEEEFDEGENAHAQKVKAMLESISPALRCEIIVSSNAAAQNLLDEFVEGKIDVAIVKQMGAIGLDVPHAKVALDLSNTRSRAYFHQRMMRVATIWHVPGYPDKPVTESVYIAPDDRITRQLVEDTLKGTGILRPVREGESPAVSTGTIDIPPMQPLTIFTPDSVVLTGEMKDSAGATAPAAFIPVTDSFRRTFPNADVPKASLAKWLEGAGVNPDAEIEDVGDDVSAPPPPTEATGNGASSTLNITKGLKAARKECSDLGNRAISKRLRAAGLEYSSETFGRMAGSFWYEQFKQVGLRGKGWSLEKIDDVAVIHTITDNIEAEIAEV